MQKEREIDGMKIISIENTTLCAANCIMCVRKKYKGSLTHMKQELFEKCVREAVQCGVEMMTLTGFGEPLMDPEIEIKLKYIKNNYPNIKVALTTTGYGLQDHLQDVICTYLDEINFSMYGMNKKTYEYVHGGALKYEENKKNIDTLLAKEKRPYVIVSYIDMPATHDDMEEWKNYYGEKADQINIWKLHRWPHSGNADMSFKQCAPCRCLRLDTLNGFYIKVDGTVSPCCFDYNNELIIGDINESSLQEIINGPALNRLKVMQEKDFLRNSDMICGDCDQLYSREDALVYTSSQAMRVGRHSLFPEEEA